LVGNRPIAGTHNLAHRTEWIKQTLATLPAGWRILDAGAGQLAHKPFCTHLRYVSQDFGQYNGQGDQQGLQTHTWDNSQIDIQCDITQIPEPDASFDAILCTEVFEHLPQPIEALREFSRLLRPQGLLILTAPFASLTHFSPYHFYSGFNRYFYQHNLPLFGFQIQTLEPNGNYFEYIAQELIRLPQIATQYTHRPLSPLARLAAALLVWSLSFVTARDKNSHQLLAYGYHLVAQRQ
jgi:ubiquinone/menaquinone biosynthesis C-methylase UbiE